MQMGGPGILQFSRGVFTTNCVWMADETLARVFDISSYRRKKRSERRSKIVKIYAN